MCTSVDWDEYSSGNDNLCPNQSPEIGRLSADSLHDGAAWNILLWIGIPCVAIIVLGIATVVIKLTWQKCRKIVKEQVQPNHPVTLGSFKLAHSEHLSLHNNSIHRLVRLIEVQTKYSGQIVTDLDNVNSTVTSVPTIYLSCCPNCTHDLCTSAAQLTAVDRSIIDIATSKHNYILCINAVPGTSSVNCWNYPLHQNITVYRLEDLEALIDDLLPPGNNHLLPLIRSEFADEVDKLRFSFKLNPVSDVSITEKEFVDMNFDDQQHDADVDDQQNDAGIDDHLNDAIIDAT